MNWLSVKYKQKKKNSRRVSLLAIFAILALFFGTAAVSEVKAQVYIFHDPFELTGSDIDVSGEELLDEDIDSDLMQASVDIPPGMLYVAIALWIIGAIVIYRVYRVKKNSKMRMHMEGMNYWKMRRIAGVIGLLVLLAIPAKSQVFLDEQTRENTQYNIAPKKARTLDRGTRDYAPLGGEVLVLGLLGGAYLLGKKKQKK